MAESIVKDFKGKLDWVYVGKSEAPKPKESKPDTLLNEYMQKVFDVAVPIGVSEVADVQHVQAALANETVSEIIPDTIQPKESRGRFAQPIEQSKQQWLSWDKSVSTPDHQNRLGKLLTSAVYMAGSFGMNFASTVMANKLFLDPQKESIRLPLKQSLSLLDESGNKEMLKAGWEYITDDVTEQLADWSVKRLTNRESIGFVSPLSHVLAKLGNTAINVFGDIHSRNQKTMIMNSLVNPGVIEGAFRFAGALPGGGFIKELYGKGNAQVMKGKGPIPFGTDLAFNMLIAKMIHQHKSYDDPKMRWTSE